MVSLQTISLQKINFLFFFSLAYSLYLYLICILISLIKMYFNWFKFLCDLIFHYENKNFNLIFNLNNCARSKPSTNSMKTLQMIHINMTQPTDVTCRVHAIIHIGQLSSGHFETRIQNFSKRRKTAITVNRLDCLLCKF